MYSGGGSISAGYIEVTTVDTRNQPIFNAMVRIHKEENGNKIFETYVRTNANGKTGDIMLEAPSMAYSYNSSQHVCPYEAYNIEIIKEGYDIEERTGVQIFANCTSTLSVKMQQCHSTGPKRNIICIDDHKLYGGQEESSCLRKL